MLKKLGIAAACGVCLYGLAKLLGRHVVVVLDGSGQLFEASASTDPGELAAEAVTGSDIDVAPRLPKDGRTSEDSSPIEGGTSAVNGVNPTRESP